MQLRAVILKGIEPLRAAQVIKHSLDARVTLYINPGSPWDNALKLLSQHYPVTHLLQEWCIISQCVFADSPLKLLETTIPDIRLQVEHAHGTKCPRCWQWSLETDTVGLCNKCQQVIGAKA